MRPVPMSTSTGTFLDAAESNEGTSADATVPVVDRPFAGPHPLPEPEQGEGPEKPAEEEPASAKVEEEKKEGEVSTEEKKEEEVATEEKKEEEVAKEEKKEEVTTTGVKAEDQANQGPPADTTEIDTEENGEEKNGTGTPSECNGKIGHGIPDGVCVFGVFDGHGGKGVSSFTTEID